MRNVTDNVIFNNAFFHIALILMKAIKSHFKGHMINSLTPVVISYEIYETRRRLVS